MKRLWAFLLVLAWGTTYAQEAPTKVTTVEGVTEYRLANGARVLLFPEASRSSITVNMTVLVGSRHEGYGESGMAHLLEHLVFKGTPTFPNVPKSLSDHGASFNGTTNFDRTNYFETLTATDDNLEFAIKLEADRLVNSYIKREDLQSEFSVVRNEFERGENSPQRVLMQRVYATAYEWHNYGKSTIGNRSDIERVPIENLQAFYKKYYQPDNVVFIVTGKFEEKKALDLVQKYLGTIPKPTRKLDKTYTEEPAQDGDRIVMLRRVGSTGSVMLGYHMPAAAHADYAPLTILGGLLSQQPNGRLYKALVESKKATSAGGSADNTHDPGLFTASASPTDSNIDEVKNLLIETMENLGKEAFTQAEIDKAKVRSQRGAEMLQANSSAMAQALSSASSLGDWRLLFIQRDRIAAVKAEDVNRVAKTYFHKSNRTVGLFIPEDKPSRLEIPATPDLAALVKDYKGGNVTAAGEAFDTSPENLDARTKIVDINGLKAGLLQKKNRGETVSLALTLHYGNEESLKDMTVAAGMLPNLMMAGTKKHDRQALREELDKLGVQISAGMGGGGGRGPRGGGGGGGGTAGQLTFSISAKKDTLVPAIKLLGEILREPAFPEADFITSKERMKAGLEATRTEPTAIAANKLARAMAPYPASDIRYVPTIDESLKRLDGVTLDQVKSIYAKQIGATDGEVGIVGDFNPEPTLAALKDILKDWKSSVPIKRIARAAPTSVTGSREDINTPDKANAVFLAGLPFAMTESDADFAAMRLGNFILGGGTLSSRLGNRIRQKEGLSYGVTSSVAVSQRDPSASFTVNATTNPANIDKVEKAFKEELALFLKEGPSLEEVGDAQRAYIEAAKVGRTSDSAIAGQILSNLQLGRTFAHTSEMEKKISALSPEEIRKAFQKHIDPNKLTIIRAGDFKK